MNIDLRKHMTDADYDDLEAVGPLVAVKLSTGWALWDNIDTTGDGVADDRYYTRFQTKADCLAEIGARHQADKPLT